MSAYPRATTPAGYALVLVLLALSAGPARAQLALYPVQGLDFGELRGGASGRIQPTDAQRRGEIELLGSGLFTVSLVLPTHMVSDAGQTLPLGFGPGDAVFRLRKTGRETSFDPTQPSTFRVPFKDDGSVIYIGGLAVPDPRQAPGTYTATVTIQVVASGT